MKYTGTTIQYNYFSSYGALTDVYLNDALVFTYDADANTGQGKQLLTSAKTGTSGNPNVVRTQRRDPASKAFLRHFGARTLDGQFVDA